MNNLIDAVEFAAEDSVELGEHERQRCEVWTRVMGYHRPAASFNIGKQGEFRERRFYLERAAQTP